MAGDLYDRDFIGWTEQQARLLREAAGRFMNFPIAWELVAEELAGLGRSERRALASQVRRAIVHLLKLQHSPALGPRAGRMASLADARAEIRGLLRDDPGLRPRLADILGEEESEAWDVASAELLAHGEAIDGITARRRSAQRYSAEQVLGPWLPPMPDSAGGPEGAR